MNRDIAPTLREAQAVEIYGAKAANLARLAAAGVPTLPGLVLGAPVFDEHLTRIGLGPGAQALFSTLDTDDAAFTQGEATRIRETLLATSLHSDLAATLRSTLDPGVTYAVRSSALGEDSHDASFAGQFESVLGCRSMDDIAHAIRQVWASMFSDRVLQYARHRGHRPRGMAVLVQRQAQAQVSGVLFTRDPRTRDSDRLLLEYAAGLGEDLVSGRITPGRLSIDRGNRQPRRERRHEGPLPWDPGTPDAAANLLNLADRLETLFGGPQDIEWTVDARGNLYVLQTRPVTTTGMPRGNVVWTNANIAENFPEPVCPLLRSFVVRGYTAYFRALGQAFGISRRRLTAMNDALDHLVGCHGGRLYYNLSNIHTVLHLAPGGGWLTRYFNQFTGAREFPAPATIPQGRIARFLERLNVAAHVGWAYLRIGTNLRRFEERVDAFARSSAPDDLGTKTPAELADLLRGFLSIRLRHWTAGALSDTAAMVCYGALRSLLRHVPDTDPGDLLKGLPGLASAIPVERLWDLSREVRANPELLARIESEPPEQLIKRLESGEFASFHAALREYLDTWGFRYSSELTLTQPTPREDPLPVLRLLRSYSALHGEGPAEVSLRQAKGRIEASRTARSGLRGLRRLAFTPVLTAAQGAIRLRERARMKQALLYTRLRLVALTLGDNLVARGVVRRHDDTLFLSMDENIALAEGRAPDPAVLRQQIDTRRREMQANQRWNPPDSFELAPGEEWRPTEGPENPADESDPDVLSGTGACGGRACGSATVVLDVSGIDRIGPGQILVTRQTDPGWAAVFFMIQGLVIERGGLLSHGAIIAREYGIPAVVGVPDATRRIADGDTVCVDGNRGRVERVRD